MQGSASDFHVVVDIETLVNGQGTSRAAGSRPSRAPSFDVRTVLITDEVSPDVADAVRFARAHGIEEIAIRAVSDQAILALDEAAVDALVACVAELGAPVASLLSPLFKAYLPGSQRAAAGRPEHPAVLRRRRRPPGERDRLPPLAARLGTDCVRVFSFLRETGATADCRRTAAIAAELESRDRACTRSRTRTRAPSAPLEELERCVLETGLRAILDPANDWYLRREPVAPRIRAVSSSGSPTCT